MCGIAGVIYRDWNRQPDPSILKAMGDAIAHRGPDADGFFRSDGIGLVHRRLSIIDLTGGDQPIANEDDSLQIVFNGEVYNYRELRERLIAGGHCFRTHSDTETLLHLYEDMGRDLVTPLRGMFAFALWDGRRRRLLLGRDRLGIKPLYLFRDHDKLVFASELKGVLAHPGVPRAVNPAALEDYLAYGVVPGARSIFRGVSKLPPAHTLLVGPDDWNSSPRRYWQLQIQADECRTHEQWIEAVRAKVDDAVQCHMVADVPVGTFLSGGVDSAAVTASARKVNPGELQSFSVGFREAAFSELPAAKISAKYFATRHVEEIVTPDCTTLVGALTHHFDEPFADPSAIPTFLLAMVARRSVKVALSGDGGDEAFGGYARYVHDLGEAAIRRRLPGWLRRGLAPVARAWPKADWLPKRLRAKTFLTNMSLRPEQAYANTLQICRSPQRRRLLAAAWEAELNGHRPDTQVCNAYLRAPIGDDLGGMIAADVEMMLPDDYLVKVDRASMAHGLEVRPPLLDHELLELSARIPSRWKVHGGESKWIFKQAFRERLPPGTIERPKQGFDVPIDQWLRGPLRPMFEDTVLARGAIVADFIDQSAALSLFRAHNAGIGRHGAVLWSLLMLAQWSNRYLPIGQLK